MNVATTGCHAYVRNYRTKRAPLRFNVHLLTTNNRNGATTGATPVTAYITTMRPERESRRTTSMIPYSLQETGYKPVSYNEQLRDA